MTVHETDNLAGYLEGGLPPATERRVEEHLTQCHRCRADLANLRAARHALEAAGRAMPAPAYDPHLWSRVHAQIAPARRAPALRPRWGLATGGFALASAVAAILFVQNAEDSLRPTQHQTVEAPQVATPASPFTSKSQAKPNAPRFPAPRVAVLPRNEAAKPDLSPRGGPAPTSAPIMTPNFEIRAYPPLATRAPIGGDHRVTVNGPVRILNDEAEARKSVAMLDRGSGAAGERSGNEGNLGTSFYDRNRTAETPSASGGAAGYGGTVNGSVDAYYNFKPGDGPRREVTPRGGVSIVAVDGVEHATSLGYTTPMTAAPTSAAPTSVAPTPAAAAAPASAPSVTPAPAPVAIGSRPMVTAPPLASGHAAKRPDRPFIAQLQENQRLRLQNNANNAEPDIVANQAPPVSTDKLREHDLLRRTVRPATTASPAELKVRDMFKDAAPGRTLYSRGEAAYSRGRVADAKADYAAALKAGLPPGEARVAHIRLGDAAVRSRDDATALKEYRAAVDIGKDADLLLKLGALYERSNDREKAHASYSEALVLAPGSAAAKAGFQRTEPR